MEIRVENHATASAEARVKARPSARQLLARNEQGQALLEFALVFVVLLPLLLGIVVFGMTFNNYLALTSATAIGAQQVSQSRGQTLDPCGVVDQAVIAQTPFTVPQNQSGLQFSMVINPPSGQTVPNPSTSGGSNATYTGAGNSFSCSSPQNNTGPAANLLANGTLTVTVTYPCNLVVYGVDFAPNCRLTAATQEAIQ
jgi:Flp pilus assembly protein TadG